MGKASKRSREKRTEPAPQARGLKPFVFVCLLLALVTAGVYWQTLHFDFVNLDDSGYVFENARVKAGLSAKTFSYAFTTRDESNWHPLTWLSLATDATIAKTTGAKLASVCHFTNLAMHIACVLLLFGVFAKMTGSMWKSAFVAAIFAVHPLHVESVAWVSERKDVLSTAFWLLTMLAYVYYTAQPKLGRYLVVAALFALGLMAKPMLVTLPIVLLLMDCWPLRRVQWTGCSGQDGGVPQSAIRSPLSAILEKIPLFALSAASCLVTYHVQREGGAMKSLASHDLGIRAANAAVSGVKYLWKMVWPVDLTVEYPHPGTSIATEHVVGAVLLLACITALVIVWRRRAPYLAVGWLWYLVTLAPVIGLVQVGSQAMADRYTYVPLIGIFLIAAWGLPSLIKARLVQVAAGILIILALVPVTHAQIGHWRNTTALYTNKSSIYPGDGAAHEALGYEAELRGDIDEAISEYTRAVELNQTLAQSHMNLGKLLAEQKDWNGSSEHYLAYIRLRPKDARAHSSLGSVLLEMKDFEGGMREFRAAIRLNPDYAQAYYNMGVALMDRQRYDEAKDCFSNAVRLKPDYATAHGNLAIALYSQGDYPGAWREVGLSRRYGQEPHPGFVATLTEKMPDPSP